MIKSYCQASGSVILDSYRRYWNIIGVHHLTFADEIIEVYAAIDDNPITNHQMMTKNPRGFGLQESFASSVIGPAAAAAKSLQSCPNLCDPRDGNLPGSSVPGILQARTLEWVAISLSNAWKWKVKVKLLSRVQLFAIPWTAAYQAPLSMGFSRQEYWSGVPDTLNVLGQLYQDVSTTREREFLWYEGAGNFQDRQKKNPNRDDIWLLKMQGQSKGVGAIWQELMIFSRNFTGSSNLVPKVPFFSNMAALPLHTPQILAGMPEFPSWCSSPLCLGCYHFLAPLDVTPASYEELHLAGSLLARQQS